MALVFERDAFLPKSALQSDSLYLWKDGHVRLFLGKDNGDRLVFYTLGMLDLYDVHWSKIKIRHEEVALKALHLMIKTLMQSITVETDAIEWYSTMPSIYTCLDSGICAKYTTAKDAIEWSGRYKTVFGTLRAPQKREPSSFTSVKDLEVGGIYHTGEDCWRKTYCFLGRGRSSGDFIWMFIGNDEAFRTDPYVFATQWHPPIDIVKSNKRVRPVTPAKSKVLGNFNAARFSENFKDFCERQQLMH